MKPLVAYLRSHNLLSVLYLDDFLLMDNSYLQSLHNISMTCKMLEGLGFLINYEKSQLTPNQTVRYLGFIYDSSNMTVRLPLDKQQCITKLAKKVKRQSQCSVREFAKMIGTLVAACPAISYGQLYTKSLERAKYLALKNTHGNYSQIMFIPQYVREDLNWWEVHISSRKSLLPPKFVLEIFSDASLSGWGIFCGGESTHGHWNEKERSKHINFLELLAASFGLKCFAKNLSGCCVLLRIDNTTAVAYINRMGGVKHPHLHALAKEIWQWCEERKLWIFASYIKSSHNTEADWESRRLSPETEFELAPYAFRKICTFFQIPEVDLFASRNNTKCRRFFSWFRDPEAEVVDAFTVPWTDLKFYAFPPSPW
ncbi:uncharacterized protein LOC135265263 isoform X1 [Tribolium castaneum]|uniref:uncharacterized protein LOC135265263 isoform X1 n=1 Tax=Tribolium castaneum TaxID=7070 RepID=UPI0030FEEEF9